MRVVFFLGAIVFLFTQSGEPLGVVLCCALNLKTKVSHTFQTHTHANKNGEKENLWQCEKEREGDERIHKKEMERLKLGPTKLWTGLVLHHKDVFVSHVISKLNRTDRFFFSKVNSRESGCACVRRGKRIGIKIGLFTNVHPFRRWNGRGITCPGERKMIEEE